MKANALWIAASWTGGLLASTLLAGGLLATLAGCAAPQAEMPLGVWEGHGRYVFERWDNGGPANYDPNKSDTRSREYKTYLHTQREELDGLPAVRVEILSLRGPLWDDPNEDRTHLIVHLRPAKRVSDHATLYVLADTAFSEDASQPEKSLPSTSVPITATCVTLGATTIVQFRYMDGFTDTLRFAGGTVTKDGMYLLAERGGGGASATTSAPGAPDVGGASDADHRDSEEKILGIITWSEELWRK